MKKIHGALGQLWEIHGLQPVPPIPCDFKLGEQVVFTNDYGVSFDVVIIGFAANADFYGRIIHHIPVGGCWNDAGWFAGKPESFSKVPA